MWWKSAGKGSIKFGKGNQVQKVARSGHAMVMY
jgi:hypothetical protein